MKASKPFIWEQLNGVWARSKELEILKGKECFSKREKCFSMGKGHEQSLKEENAYKVYNSSYNLT